MRMGIIAIGAILVIIGIILIPIGEVIISGSRHSYGQDKEMLLLGRLIKSSGLATIIAGIIATLTGFFKTAKRTKVEKLEAKIKERQLKDELRELKKKKVNQYSTVLTLRS